MFYPRGGSAHAARALVLGLREHGCEVTLVAGSRGDLEEFADAKAFYGDVHAVRFDEALGSEDPLRYEGPPGTAPIHPSFEDRAGAPDRVFAALDDLDYERQVRAWSRELEAAGAHSADVFHLHHLTPLNEAASRAAPHVPIVGQLHGTELLMLEQIAKGPPEGWLHAERWASRMRTWAHRCARLVTSPAGVDRAIELLELPAGRVIGLPGGVDVDRFAPRQLDREQFWREVLVEHPRGWLPGRQAGSARYHDADAAALAQAVVLLYVGRFTAVKRLDRLIAAFGAARGRFAERAALVLVGGHPGECEGEHPAQIAARLGAAGVFLAGWYGQDALPRFFCAADAVVSASEREQFGQVLIEGMACGLPAVATRTLGPAAIIDHGQTGWLVPPGNVEALAGAIVEVVEDSEERRRRGRLARIEVCERFTWTGISSKLLAVLDDAARGARRSSGSAAEA